MSEVVHGNLSWQDVRRVTLVALPIAVAGGILPPQSISMGNAASLLILAIITGAVLFYSPLVQPWIKRR